MAMAMVPTRRNQNKVYRCLGTPLQGRITTGTHVKIDDTYANGCNMDAEEQVRTLCKHGRLKEALQVLHVMDLRGVCVDVATVDSLLQGCLSRKALQEGKLVHAHIIQTGFRWHDIFLANKLVTMYAKCGSLSYARRALNQMDERNVVSWTVMIAAYAKNGMDKEALELFYQMQQSGTKPNQYTYASVLPACGNLEALQEGKEIHEEINRRGFECDVFVVNALIDMYAKCGCMEIACDVFGKMPCPDVVSFNTMISGYAQNGHIDEASKIFEKMPQQDVAACNTMISGYTQNGHIDEAFKIFQKMPQRDVFSWTAMVAAYAKHGMGKEALELFRQMQLSGTEHNQFTCASVLLACANMEALQQGKEIHEDIKRRGFESDVSVGNALIDMYAKCGFMENACNVFDKMHCRDTVSYNTMISGYAQEGHVDEAFKIFQKMPQRNIVSCNAMISGYAQTGHIDEAYKIFQQMPQHDVFSWTAMIAAYVKHGMGKEALETFHQMLRSGTKPNQYTCANVLPACANMESPNKEN